MPVRALLPRELGCESDDSDVLFEFLKRRRHCRLVLADTYGRNLRLPVTLTGASTFKPAVHCHKALDAV